MHHIKTPLKRERKYCSNGTDFVSTTLGKAPDRCVKHRWDPQEASVILGVVHTILNTDGYLGHWLTFYAYKKEVQLIRVPRESLAPQNQRA